jgi:Periplasmic glycine betaine/choline-binding (lipo)protein of an ABC-type transport system (osmoprotectant binding protein)
VRVTTGLGSSIARQAQETGQLDLMWEYTGVSLVSYNHIDERMPSAEATYARVKELDAKKDLIWLTPSKFSNTYALGLPKQVAEAYPQVNTISDLNQVLRDESQRKHLVALDTEFANRPDGLVGLKEMYDLQVGRANIRQMDAGLVYTAMHNNQVFAGLVYTTDGRLSAFNLKLLEDDKHYFPDYTAAPVVRKQGARRQPETGRPAQATGRAARRRNHAPAQCQGRRRTPEPLRGGRRLPARAPVEGGTAMSLLDTFAHLDWAQVLQLTWQHIMLVALPSAWRSWSACRWAS